MNHRSSANWHYPRTALAEKVLNGFEAGLAERLTIFAPRKRGKTEFVQRDITPMARERGVLVVYVDFWRDKSSPARAFATAVMSARKEHESWFKQVVGDAGLVGNASLKASLKLWGGDLSLEVSPQRAHAEKAVIEAAFSELEATNKPVLLLLDEVQHLATSPDFDDFTAALRSFMTARSDQKVKGIFTGSSQEGLAQLFKRTKAPFFNASSQLEFPDLGADFVEFELDVFERVTGGIALDQTQALDIFSRMQQSPGQFTDLLKRMALDEIHHLDEGFARFYGDLLEEENQQFTLLWQGMSRVDQALLIMISRGLHTGLYSDSYKAQLKQLFPELDENKNSVIQNAVNRLKSHTVNAIYSSEHGVWRFTDPSFKRFVQSQDDL